ncbi:MAG: STAS domain-containing protein [Vicinamibacteria bacterium]|nr:STAS domain-containing protein [Vicinamibacteria bacterium]
MEMREHRIETALVVAPQGRVDSNSSGVLETAILGHAGEPRLLVDLSGVEYISSAGLRVFLMLARKVKEGGGRLVLCGMGASVKQVFDLAGFTALFAVEATLEQGAARLSS